MDNDLAFGITYATAIGSGLMAGLFSMFSLFVMRALDALPTPQGIAAMQSINRKILNPIFLLTFAGVGIAAVGLAIYGLFRLDGAVTWWLVTAAIAYGVGVFMLTGGYHVPRNDKLDALDPETAEAARYWADYVKSWTAMNHVRAAGSIATLGSLIMALRVG